MKILLATDGAQMPTKADEGSAGYDLFVSEDFIVEPGRNIVPTGLKMQIDFGWEGHIRPRSGFSAKGIEGISRDFNTRMKRRHDADVIQGTIDSSYRGLVGIIVYNRDVRFRIEKGTRLAQIVFERCYTGELEQADELDETERGSGGFGHSGTK